MSIRPEIPSTTPLCMATVCGRKGFELKSMAKFDSPYIKLYRDTPQAREVRELRLYAAGHGYIETRYLTNFNKERNSWETEGPVSRETLDSYKDVKRVAKVMLQEIEESGLQPYSGNTAVMESYYPQL